MSLPRALLPLLGGIAMCTASPAAPQPPVVLQNVVDEFARVSRAFPDVNPVRTDLMLRLVCLRSAGITDVDYATLVMLAGFGTSFAYHAKDYWLMYQPPDSPEETAARLVAGTGLSWEHLPKVSSPEEAWARLREAVDAGTPLEGNYLDDYLFVGYREGGAAEERQVYCLGGWREPGWMNWKDFSEWAREFGRLGRPGPQVARESERVLAQLLLPRLVTWAEHDGRAGVDFMKHGTFGLAGLAAYAADVADVAKGPEAFDVGWLGCHAINRQSSGRQCAAAYFTRVAALFPEPTAGHLRAAALHERAACSHWDDFGRQLGRFGPGDGEDYKTVWSTPHLRTAGAAAIRQAAACEARAIREVRLALQALPQQER